MVRTQDGKDLALRIMAVCYPGTDRREQRSDGGYPLKKQANERYRTLDCASCGYADVKRSAPPYIVTR